MMLFNRRKILQWTLEEVDVPEWVVNRLEQSRSETKLSTSDSLRWSRILDALQIGYPPEYLVNRIPFHGVEVEVIPGVFIPRVETEWMVEEALRYVDTVHPSSVYVVELFCGTGAPGIALTKALLAENIPVNGLLVDWDVQAIRCTWRNLLYHGLQKHLMVLRGNVLDEIWIQWFQKLVWKYHNSFRIVLANPPYVWGRGWNLVDTSVRQYEPNDALFLENPQKLIRAFAQLFIQNTRREFPVDLVLVEGSVDLVSRLLRTSFPKEGVHRFVCEGEGVAPAWGVWFSGREIPD